MEKLYFKDYPSLEHIENAIKNEPLLAIKVSRLGGLRCKTVIKTGRAVSLVENYGASSEFISVDFVEHDYFRQPVNILTKKFLK